MNTTLIKLCKPTAVIAVLVGVSLHVASGGVANAQSKSDSTVLLKAGIQSISQGKSTEAIDQLGRAINSGKLSESDMAIALYRRGEAYGQAGKFGQAIADLTNAIFLKNLGKIDKAQAYRARAAAYSKLGMDSEAQWDINAAKNLAPDLPPSAPPASNVAAKKTAPPKVPVNAAARPRGNGSPQVALQGNTGKNGAPSSSGVPQWTPQVSNNANGETANTSVPAKPQTSSFDPVESVTSFFENLIPGLGGGQSAPPAPSPPVAPVATVPPATVQPGAAPKPLVNPPLTKTEARARSTAPKVFAKNSAQQAQGRPVWQAQPVARSGVANKTAGNNRPVWMADPNVTTPQPPPVVPIAIPGEDTQKRVVKAKAAIKQKPLPRAPEIVGAVVPKKAPVVKKTPPVRNKVAAVTPPKPKAYLLQLGSAQTKDEAKQIWGGLSAAHPNLLSGLTPTITAMTRQGAGSYYLVGLGPFDSKSSTETICKSFKQQGISCRVAAK